jgi:hypothetical protein
MAENVLEQLLIDVKTIGVAVAGGEIARLSGHVKKADEAAGKAAKTHGRLGQAFGGVKGIAATTAGVIGAQGMTGAMGESIVNAIQMQRSQAQLGNAIKKNVHEPAEGATEQMSKFADSMSLKGGFAPWQNVGAMAQYVRITKDTTQAQKDLSLATDIARGSHRSFGQATQAVMMVENGRATSLRRLGIAIDPVTKAQDKLRDSHVKVTSAMRNRAKEEDKAATRTKALEVLQKRFGGATAAYSKTAEGAMGNFRNALEVLSTKLGAVFLPILTKVFNALSKFVGQMMSGKGAGGTFVDILKAIGKGFSIIWDVLKILIKFQIEYWKLCFTVGKAIVTAFMAAFNWLKKAATDTAKWVVNAWNNAKNWVVAAFNNIKKGAQAVWNWIRNAATNTKNWVVDRFNDMKKGAQVVWNWMRGAATAVKNWIVDRFNDVKNGVVNAFNSVKSAVQTAWTWIKTQATNVKTWVIDRFNDIVNFIKSLPGKIKSAFGSGLSGIRDMIISPFRDAFKWVQDHLPTFHTHHIGPISVPLPSFPHLQSGGLVQSHGTYLVGERGPELVSLPRGAYVTPNERLRGNARDNSGPQQAERPIVIYNVLDSKIVSKSVIRQGLLQSSRS